MSATTDAPRARFRPWSARRAPHHARPPYGPNFSWPIHGEYRHLIQHRDLARDWGIAPERTFILDDGEPLTLLPDTIRLEEKIPADSILVDGKGVGDVGNLVLRERQLLGGDGVVVVVLVLDEETGEVIHGPDMISKGFVFEQQFSHLLEDAKCLVPRSSRNFSAARHPAPWRSHPFLPAELLPQGRRTRSGCGSGHYGSLGEKDWGRGGETFLKKSFPSLPPIFSYCILLIGEP